MSALKTLVVSTFPNAKALPLWAGADAGVFARHGIELVVDETESSAAQREKLAGGDIHIAQAAVDNALSMIAGGRDVIIVMGGESGMNDFIVRPEIETFADFRGRTLLVDSPDTAYALQARELLGRAGLEAYRDYAIHPAGNSGRRCRALMTSAEFAGAVLNPPFSSQALLGGMKSLGRMVDLLGPYQAGGAFLLRRFARDNAEIVEDYIRGYVESLEYVADPANAAAMTATLARRLELAPDVAEATLRQIVDPGFGFTTKAKLDRVGLANVLATRARTEGPDARLADSSRWIDEGYYIRAITR